MKVLGLGDNVCDVYLHTGTMYPGGQALNFAVYAHQLGLEADYMGVFGEDAVGDHVKKTLRDQGVGYSHCRSYPGENGYARVTLDHGDRVFMGSNHGGVLQQHPIFLTAEDLNYLSQFRLIYTTNNGFLDNLLPVLQKVPGMVSYDFSYRWNEEDRLERVCPYVDFGFLSCSDLGDEETVDLCRKLHHMGCGTVTATRGSRGTITFDGVGFFVQRPKLVQAVDTLGAGDSFATAMLVTILRLLEQDAGAWRDPGTREKILPQALQAAAEFAAETCMVSGAFGWGTPIPESLRGTFYEGFRE